MTQEEKAKAYDDAVKAAKSLSKIIIITALHSGVLNMKETAEALIFLEKQGEQKSYASETMDEKGDFDNGFTRMMEKEQKSAWSEKYIADVFEKVGLAKIVREQGNDNLTNALQDAMIELSKFIPRPKQEWSEEDKTIIDSLLDVLYRIKKGKEPQATTRLIEQHINFIESLKERYAWKPSDEQILALQESIGIVGEFTLRGEILKKLEEQLKKLREE